MVTVKNLQVSLQLWAANRTGIKDLFARLRKSVGHPAGALPLRSQAVWKLLIHSEQHQGAAFKLHIVLFRTDNRALIHRWCSGSQFQIRDPDHAFGLGRNRRTRALRRLGIAWRTGASRRGRS